MESQRSDHSAMQAKAAAAAKLVLQDLDPGAKKKRQLFTSGPPQGILTLHLKTMKNFSKTYFVTSSFASGSETHRLFLKTSVQNFTKSTKIVQARKDPTVSKQKRNSGLWSRNSAASQDFLRERNNTTRDSTAASSPDIRINEVKVFCLDLASNKEDLSNRMNFELIEVCGRTRAIRSLGVGTLHIFDLIKEMYGYQTLSLTLKDKQIADLQFEYIFRYGIFGYGYSHELEQNDIFISNAMKESMFFKLHPHPNRADDNGLLIPARIKALSLVKAHDEEKTVSTKNMSSIEHLIRNRGRLEKLKGEYKSLQTSHDRTKYLRNFLHQSASVDSYYDGLSVDGNTNNTQTSSQPTRARQRIDSATEAIGNLTPLLLMAPGLNSRNDTRSSATTTTRNDRNQESDLMERLREMYKETKMLDNSANESDDSNEDKTQREPKRTSISTKSDQKKGFLNILRKKVLTPIRLGKLLSDNRSISPHTHDIPDVEEQTRPSREDISPEYKSTNKMFGAMGLAKDAPSGQSSVNSGSIASEVRDAPDSVDTCSIKNQDELH